MPEPASPSASHRTLADQLTQLLSQDGYLPTAIPGLTLLRSSRPTPRVPVIYQPSLYVVAQGQKQAYLGDEIYRYDACNYLVLPVPMPLEANVIEASPAHPYLALRLELDLAVLGELLLQMDVPATKSDLNGDTRGLYVSSMEPDLYDSLQRLLDCLADPDRQQVLGPMIIKEALFHLLRGKQGAHLRTFAQHQRHHHQIARVLQHIQHHYASPLEVNGLAALANMSPSSLHHHFKAVTGLSPIQYLKTTRLHQARRMMLHDDHSISDAAFKVGYANPSQFSREYKRLFGSSPREDRQQQTP